MIGHSGGTLCVALAHEKYRGRVSANHAVRVKGSIAHLARRVAADAPDLYVVDFFSLNVAVVGIAVTDSSLELNVREKLAAVTLPQLQISNNEVRIVHVLHGNCGRRVIEGALVLIRVVDLQTEVNGLRVENLLLDASRRVLRIYEFLAEVHSVDLNNETIDELVAREHIEGATHEEMVVRRLPITVSCVEQIVLDTVEHGHEGEGIKGKEVDLTGLHAV